jgi:hypothetical protein
VNTHASAGFDEKSSPRIVLRLLGFLLVFVMGVAVGWGAHSAYGTASSIGAMTSQVGQLLDQKHITSVEDGLNQAKAALNSQRFQDAERTLASLKEKAAKDGQIAALQASLVSAQIGRALSDKQLDRARELLEKAKASTFATADQIRSWEEQIRNAQSGSASASASSATASH